MDINQKTIIKKSESFLLTTSLNGENNYKLKDNHICRVFSLHSQNNKMILNDLNIIKHKKYDNKINFISNDLNLINFKYINSKNYNDNDGILNHNNSKIISILIKKNNKKNITSELYEAIDIVINIFNNKMEFDDRIKMINVSKRNGEKNKSLKNNKIIIKFNYLIKIFFDNTYVNSEIKELLKNIVDIYDIKIKVDDKNIDKELINERGIKKNNWINL